MNAQQLYRKALQIKHLAHNARNGAQNQLNQYNISHDNINNDETKYNKITEYAQYLSKLRLNPYMFSLFEHETTAPTKQMIMITNNDDNYVVAVYKSGGKVLISVDKIPTTGNIKHLSQPKELQDAEGNSIAFNMFHGIFEITSGNVYDSSAVDVKRRLVVIGETNTFYRSVEFSLSIDDDDSFDISDVKVLIDMLYNNPIKDNSHVDSLINSVSVSNNGTLANEILTPSPNYLKLSDDFGDMLFVSFHTMNNQYSAWLNEINDGCIIGYVVCDSSTIVEIKIESITPETTTSSNVRFSLTLTTDEDKSDVINDFVLHFDENNKLFSLYYKNTPLFYSSICLVIANPISFSYMPAITNDTEKKWIFVIGYETQINDRYSLTMKRDENKLLPFRFVSDLAATWSGSVIMYNGVRYSENIYTMSETVEQLRNDRILFFLSSIENDYVPIATGYDSSGNFVAARLTDDDLNWNYIVKATNMKKAKWTHLTQSVERYTINVNKDWSSYPEVDPDDENDKCELIIFVWSPHHNSYFKIIIFNSKSVHMYDEVNEYVKPTDNVKYVSHDLSRDANLILLKLQCDNNEISLRLRFSKIYERTETDTVRRYDIERKLLTIGETNEAIVSAYSTDYGKTWNEIEDLALINGGNVSDVIPIHLPKDSANSLLNDYYGFLMLVNMSDNGVIYYYNKTNNKWNNVLDGLFTSNDAQTVDVNYTTNIDNNNKCVKIGDVWKFADVYCFIEFPKKNEAFNPFVSIRVDDVNECAVTLPIHVGANIEFADEWKQEALNKETAAFDIDVSYSNGLNNKYDISYNIESNMFKLSAVSKGVSGEQQPNEVVSITQHSKSNGEVIYHFTFTEAPTTEETTYTEFSKTVDNGLTTDQPGTSYIPGKTENDYITLEQPLTVEDYTEVIEYDEDTMITTITQIKNVYEYIQYRMKVVVVSTNDGSHNRKTTTTYYKPIDDTTTAKPLKITTTRKTVYELHITSKLDQLLLPLGVVSKYNSISAGDERNMSSMTMFDMIKCKLFSYDVNVSVNGCNVVLDLDLNQTYKAKMITEDETFNHYLVEDNPQYQQKITLTTDEPDKLTCSLYRQHPHITYELTYTPTIDNVLIISDENKGCLTVNYKNGELVETLFVIYVDLIRSDQLLATDLTYSNGKVGVYKSFNYFNMKDMKLTSENSCLIGYNDTFGYNVYATNNMYLLDKVKV